MKYCVHITIVASIEVEASSQKEAKNIALQSVEVTGANQFDSKAVIFETYKDENKKIRRGIGSY